MLSFCVTYYNQQKYVSRSLESILNQKLSSDFEILIGDDGSSDETQIIINEYQKKYPNIIKLFVQPRDITKKYLSVTRASLNRLNLLSHAHGEYVCFMDGDDSYCNYEFIENAIKNLNENPELVGIAHNYVVVNQNGEKEYHHKMTNKSFITLSGYASNLYIHVGAIVFRRQNLDSLNTIKKLCAFDDNDITYYFLNYGKLLYKDIDVYNYFSNNESICSSTDELEMMLLNALDYSVIKKIIKKCHFTLFLRYFKTRYYVYKKRNELVNDRYQKWKLWSYKKCLDYKVLNWKKQTIYIKVYIIFCMNIQNIFINAYLFIKGCLKKIYNLLM